MVAVTVLIPAVWLVTEISTVPSGCVVTVGAVVAPLPAIKPQPAALTVQGK
nr:hypothetical protein [Escherichia coli]